MKQDKKPVTPAHNDNTLQSAQNDNAKDVTTADSLQSALPDTAPQSHNTQPLDAQTAASDNAKAVATADSLQSVLPNTAPQSHNTQPLDAQTAASDNAKDVATADSLQLALPNTAPQSHNTQPLDAQTAANDNAKDVATADSLQSALPNTAPQSHNTQPLDAQTAASDNAKDVATADSLQSALPNTAPQSHNTQPLDAQSQAPSDARKKPKKRKDGSLRFVLKFLRPYGGYIGASFFFATICTVASLFVPVITGRAIDTLIEGAVDFGALSMQIFALLGVIAAVLIFQWLMSVCAQKAAFCTVRDMREAAFNAVSDAPISYVDTHPHGDIIARLSVDVEQISDGVIQGFTQIFTGLITVIGTLFFMLSLNGYVTLVVVLVTPLSIVLSYLIARFCHKFFTRQSATRGNLSTFCEELITERTALKAYNYSERGEAKFDALNDKYRESAEKAMFSSAMINPGTRFINSIVYVCVAIMGALIVIRTNGESLSIGGLTSFLLYANQYTKPFNEITGVFTELQTALASAHRVMDVTSAAAEVQTGAMAIPITGSVVFDDVSFSYSPDRKLIENFSLQTVKGMRVAVVGPTGCGKTTLINLLMRFYEPTGGAVRYDGIDAKEYTLQAVRSSYGMVLQDSWIFKGTVRENIAYSKPNATDEEIKAAAEKAHIAGFISRLPNGYDTIIDDDDSLSQGQKQLINIARVMLLDPPMLILDEATSNIDTRTESRVQKAFRNLTRPTNGEKKTCFIVAHRLSTIVSSDLILVMKDGNIIEKGTHKELMRRHGFYYDLYTATASATE